MRIVLRADATARIGGGHMMRCLTLAEVARDRGHDLHFLMVSSPLNGRIRASGFELTELEPRDHAAETEPAHAHWLSLPWKEDADQTAKVGADWYILDHYGLDARWVDRIRRKRPDARFLAFDDLDDRVLSADLVLDPARVGNTPRTQPVSGTLDGPDFALLRPEFAAERPRALERRGGMPKKLLILPGMLDAAGLAPLALAALRRSNIEVEVVMGSHSQSRDAVEAIVAERRNWSLTLDATNMAELMRDADICIGAGGGTAWERCCLGLPSVAVAVAENQRPGIAALAEAGAAILADMETDLSNALSQLVEGSAKMSRNAAQLCDGQGANRVMDAIEAELRPLEAADRNRLFDWRNRPDVRAVSRSQDPLDPDEHADWLTRTLDRRDGLWKIYSEGTRPLGVVSATRGPDDCWTWSFHIGAAGAPKGAGGRMLTAFLRHLRAETDAAVVRGEVRRDNTPSIRLHQRLGFDEVASGTPDMLVFEHKLAEA